MSRSRLIVAICMFLCFVPAVLAVFCPRCGVENADANKFCRNCGLPITEVSKYVGFLEEREKELLKLMGTGQTAPADSGEGAPGLMAGLRDGDSHGPGGNGAVSAVGPGREEPDDAGSALPLSSAGADASSRGAKSAAGPSGTAGAKADDALPRARDLLKAGFESMKPVGEGSIVIMMTYSAKGGARPFTLPGKVYLNSTYLGEIQVVEQESKVDYGFSSDLFGKMSSHSDEVHYKFMKPGIPAGKYQVKVIMQQKGFLRNVSRYKVFPDVTVNPDEEAKLFYTWDAKTPFGK